MHVPILTSRRFRSLTVGLLVVCILFTRSPSQAQAAPSSYGCLDITNDHTGVTSRYDLATGIVHELSRDLPDLYGNPRSPDTKHFIYITDIKKLISASLIH